MANGSAGSGCVAARSARLGCVRADAFAFDAPAVTGMHAHADGGVAVMLRGTLRLVTQARVFNVDEGEALLIPAGVQHAEVVEQRDVHCVLMRFGPGVVRPESEPRMLAGAVAEDLRQPTRLIGRALWMADATMELRVRQAATDVVHALDDDGPRPNAFAWLQRIMDVLDARIASPPRLAELAEVAEVRHEHLARAFRRHMGVPVGEFMRRRQVRQAARLLRETTLALSQLALQTGFSDQSHLTRTFRRYRGVTPGQYRALYTRH